MALTDTKSKIKIVFFFDPATGEAEEYATVEYRNQIQRDGVDVMQEYSQEQVKAAEAKKLVSDATVKVQKAVS